MYVPNNLLQYRQDKYDKVIKCVMEMFKFVEMHFLYKIC